MFLLQALISLGAAVFAVGAVARFALPGPDPLPVWLTAVFGLAGSALGGLITATYVLAAGGGEPAYIEGQGVFVTAACACATGVYFLYRRFVQGRPITGEEARRLPLKPRGLNRILRRKPHRWLEETAEPGPVPLEQLAKLVALRDAGKIDRTSSSGGRRCWSRRSSGAAARGGSERTAASRHAVGGSLTRRTAGNGLPGEPGGNSRANPRRRLSWASSA